MPSATNHIQNKSLSRNVPKFLIIGVQKAGTTTMFNILNKAKYFSGASLKEIHYFDTDYRYQKGIDWYLDYFLSNKEQVAFEATPSYIYSRRTPKRIFDTFGSMKFIVMLRDPVKRCFSAWNMFRNFNKDRAAANYIYGTFVKHSSPESKENIYNLLFTNNFPSFDQCVDEDIDRYQLNVATEEPSFVRRGLYYEQIMRYLNFFTIQDFHFLEQNEFSANIGDNVTRIKTFLGVPNILEADTDWIQMHSNKGDYDDVECGEYDSTLLRLYDFYYEHNEKLFKLIDRRYAWGASWW